MASVAIKFNESKKRWEGLVNGRVKSHSTHLDYVQNKMTALGYRVAAEQDIKEDAKKVDEFGITKRFEFVKQMVSMVAKKTVASAIITGQGGLGKTHSVIRALKDCGLQDVTDLASFEIGTRLQGSKSFRIIKGFSTAKGLYRSLFEGNGMTLVFDDCDSVLKDPVALNLLKGALDSYGERYISWNADIKDEDLPRSFKFTGSIVFISNKDMESLDQAVRSRALCVDLSMSEEQKIERMETIVDDAEFLPEYSKEYKHDALEFLRSMVKSVQNLSLRSLISVVKIRAEGGDWKQLAKYVLTAGA
ncbi:hypothetical protein EBU95_15620 [bacterium]|nr:hypothetical protein [bacterium]